ncbi:MAG: ChaN family lipoprotein [Nitrospirae bacterium]|nr:ChaN family lipoprotein [Nitrospirota bacterium]
MKNLIIVIAALFFFSGSCLSAYGYASGDECVISVYIDPSSSSLRGTMELRAVKNNDTRFAVGSLSIDKVMVDGKNAAFQIEKGMLKISGNNQGSVFISFAGKFPSQEYMINQSSYISSDGIFLSGIWHPRPDQPCIYRMKADLPAGYIAVSEADRITSSEDSGRAVHFFEFNHNVEGITLSASNNFVVLKDSYRDIELYAYFFRDDVEIANDYLRKVKDYISMYEKMLGSFPYKRFSVVENIYPTGYAMPTYTLLGRDVVRLPFIINTSLGHELLHQWFGNYVRPDYEKGNWSEGITTYLADHLYEEQTGRGAEYRKGMLTDIRSYSKGAETTVRQFSHAQDRASRAKGYSSAAMIFHMLRKDLGDDRFYSALKNFIKTYGGKKASWEDIRLVFERAASKDMSVFFSQWLDRKDLPMLSFGNPSVKYIKGLYNVEFDLVQSGRPYRFNLPVAFHTSSGIKRIVFKINGKVTRVGMSLEHIPDKIVVDDNYDLLRQLSDDEVPPLFSAHFGAQKTIVSLPDKNYDAYKNIIDYYKKSEALIKPDSEVTGEDLASASVVVLDKTNRYASGLYDMATGADFYIKAIKSPYSSQNVMVFLNASSMDAADSGFRRIQHYGKYSEIAFSTGGNSLKNRAASTNGVVLMIKSDKNSVPLSAVLSIRDTAMQVKDKKIIYVGEEHNKFSHHLTQLEIIKTLHEQGKKVAIGMEMFYRTSQTALDAYTSGDINEQEFLKKSSYFRQWGFDYSLYKPILDFARTHKLKVVALNLPRKIVSKVGASGIDSLAPDERSQMPAFMDYSDEDYKSRLAAIMETHSRAEKRNFDNFFQAQVLWDEYMAESVDMFMKANADHTMVVIVGGGHLSYGSGIPKRAFRRNSLPYAIILNGENMSPGIADYVVMPDSVYYQKSPVMMVMLKETEKGLEIAGFPEGSSAQEAGLKEGDLILSVGDIAIKDLEDLRIELFYRTAGEKVMVSVIRNRFLLGDIQKEFEVLLR